MTVANNETLPILFRAKPTLTFYRPDGEVFSFQHEFNVIEGVDHEVYIGNDILAGQYKRYETANMIVLSKSPSDLPEIDIQQNKNLFAIPIRTHADDDSFISCTDNSFDMTLSAITPAPEQSTQLDENLSGPTRSNRRKHLKPYRITETAILASISPGKQQFLDDLDRNDNPVKAPKPDQLANSHDNMLNSPALDELEMKDYTTEELIENLDIAHLSEEDQEMVRDLFRTHIDVLARNELDVQHTPLIQATIDLLNDQPDIMNCIYHPVPKHLFERAMALIDYYLIKNILQHCTKPSPILSNALFILKRSGAVRCLLDARLVNSITQKMAQNMTSHCEILALMADTNHLTCIDLSNAYFSIGLDPEMAPLTSFIDPLGRRLMFRSLPQGFKNSGSFLQVALAKLLHDIPTSLFVADDIIICTKGTFAQHLLEVSKVCERLKEGKFRISHLKVAIDKPYTEFLGILYNKLEMTIPPKQLQKYAALQRPIKPGQIKSFLASISFFRRFLKDWAEITKPLHEASKPREKTATIKWNNELQQSFVAMKKVVAEANPLHVPSNDLPYRCYIRANSTALACDIVQVNQDNSEIPIAFNSRLTTKTEANYSYYRQLVCALLYGLDSFSFFFINAPQIMIRSSVFMILFNRLARGANTCLVRNYYTISRYRLQFEHTNKNPPDQNREIIEKINPTLFPTEEEKQLLLSKLPDHEIEAFMQQLSDPNHDFTADQTRNLFRADEMPNIFSTRQAHVQTSSPIPH